MESNLNGAVNGNEDFLHDFPDFPADFSTEWNSNDNFAPLQDNQQFYPPFDHSSTSFPAFNHHHNYQDDYGNYQYHDPNQIPPYYDPNAHQDPFQSFPSQPVTQPQDFQQPPVSSQSKLVQPQYTDYGRDYHTPPLIRELSPTIPPRPVNYDFVHDRDLSPRTVTSPFYRDPSPKMSYEDPMQRMKQLTKQSYGGSLAASAAAVEAAEAAQAARRNSPPIKKREGAEETVRDVLQRQYQEQKRQMQMLRCQSGLPPPSFPSSLVFSKPTQKHPSIRGDSASGLPSDSQSLGHHSSATLTSTIPSDVTSKSSETLSGSPPKGADSVTLLSSGTPLNHLPPPTDKKDFTPVIDSPSNTDVKKNDVISIKTPPQSLLKANTTALEATASDQNTTVVQSLLSGNDEPSSSSSSRKRPLEGERSVPLKPGPRMEINEKGEKVERVYVLVHHCNANDPEWAKDGVIMPIEEYKKQEKRDDMITFSYSSVISPYEYVDWRVKRFPLTEQDPNAATTSAEGSAVDPIPFPSEVSAPLA